MSLLHRAVLIALACAITAPATRAEADYDLVGKVSAMMLRNLHFNKQPFDEALSNRVLDEYLGFLDFQRVYFLQEDVDRFRQQYGNRLHRLLLDADSMEAAKDIFTTYLRRVEDRHAFINKRLQAHDYTFDGDGEVMLSREDAPWPKNEAEADAIWNRRLEENLLREELRLRDGDGEEESDDAEGGGAGATSSEPSAGEGASVDASGGEEPGSGDQPDPATKIQQRYKRVLENLRETNDEEICDYLLSSLAAVYDPHTDYFSHSEEVQFQTSMKNSLTGIGALLEADDDGTTQIKGIVVNGPADREGSLQLDDRIIGVDSRNSGEMVDIVYMKINKVVELIRGPENTEVRLKVIPAEDPGAIRNITILREKVELKDQLTTAQLIRRERADGGQDSIGWIDVPSFYADLENGTTGVTKDVRRLLARLKAEGIDALVIDLRGNGGGSLDEAVSLTSLFIDKGPVVQAKDSGGAIKVLESPADGAFYKGPLVVLTDKTSASASEIFAAALQDFNRAVIVGDKSTFGKGTVQTVAPIGRAMPLFADSQRAGSLKVTIQKFYRIAGGSTQLRGVVPDISLPSRIEALEIGEDSLDNPLPYDTIPSLPREVLDRADLHLTELAKASAARVSESEEFAWIREDIARMKDQMKRNANSLNIEERLREREENEERTRSRNARRRERFAVLEKEEAPRTSIYKLTLDNLGKNNLEAQVEFGSDAFHGMRRSEDEEEDLDKAPDFPFGFDPHKRETLAIATDLIHATRKAEGARTVKVEN